MPMKKYDIRQPLKDRLAELGVNTDAELAMLKDRVLSTVASRQAKLDALDAQIATLQAQRDELANEISVVQTTIDKLLIETVPLPTY